MFNSPKIVDLGIALFAAILIFASAAQAESLYIATAGGSFGILDTELQTYTELGTTSAVYAGLADQDAVVPLSNAASQTTRLIWDDTRYVTAVVVLNPSSVSNTVYFIVRDMNGTITGSGTFALQAKSKIAASLRDLPGLAGVIGTQGSVEFSVDRGNIAVTGFGFHDTALTVIPTSEQ